MISKSISEEKPYRDILAVIEDFELLSIIQDFGEELPEEDFICMSIMVEKIKENEL